MQFYRKKARTMGVPIVPMIDILTILLIFSSFTPSGKSRSPC